MTLIEIDGSQGEGGGQILRTSLALSLLTGKPFRLYNIRARRPKPGLQPQHLMCVEAAATIAPSQVRGAALGSSDLTFEPGAVKAGDYHFRIPTAGATGLVLHTVYLPLAFTGADSRVTIEGGTHVLASPCFHFLETTWRAYLKLMGLQIELSLDRPGFYPRGGGRMRAVIHGCRAENLCGLVLEGEMSLGTITGFSAVAGLPLDIARRQKERAVSRLKNSKLNVDDIDIETWPGGPGCVFALIASGTPAPSLFFGLGARGKRAEKVADEAVDQLLDFQRHPAVDSHSGDQIILPLACAAQPSHFRAQALTNHLVTNIDTIGRFLDRRIRSDGLLDQPGVVSC